MTNEEFMKEALAYKDCPPDFEKRYEFFCKYQRIVIEMLKEFVAICNSHDIVYQLAFGSLMGAVRDGGQIPWDYDVDVIVPFYEMEKLYSALDQDLDSRYCYYAPEKDKTYRTSFVRIVPKGYPNQMLHVDIFNVTGLPEDENERQKYCEQIRTAFRARVYIVENLADYHMSFRTKLLRTFMKIRYLVKYRGVIHDNTQLFSKYDIRMTEKATVISGKAGKKIDPARWYLNSIDYETREGVFRIPKDYDELLTDRYGDWKQYFPIEKRIAEVYSICDMFEWYEKLRDNLNNPRIKR